MKTLYFPRALGRTTSQLIEPPCCGVLTVKVAALGKRVVSFERLGRIGRGFTGVARTIPRVFGDRVGTVGTIQWKMVGRSFLNDRLMCILWSAGSIVTRFVVNFMFGWWKVAFSGTGGVVTIVCLRSGRRFVDHVYKCIFWTAHATSTRFGESFAMAYASRGVKMILMNYFNRRVVGGRKFLSCLLWHNGS